MSTYVFQTAEVWLTGVTIGFEYEAAVYENLRDYLLPWPKTEHLTQDSSYSVLCPADRSPSAVPPALVLVPGSDNSHGTLSHLIPTFMVA